MSNPYKIPREMRYKWLDFIIPSNQIKSYEVYEGLRFDLRADRECVVSINIRENKPLSYEDVHFYVHEQLMKGRLTIKAIKGDVIDMIGNLEAISIIEQFGLNHGERFIGYR